MTPSAPAAITEAATPRPATSSARHRGAGPICSLSDWASRVSVSSAAVNAAESWSNPSAQPISWGPGARNRFTAHANPDRVAEPPTTTPLSVSVTAKAAVVPARRASASSWSSPKVRTSDSRARPSWNNPPYTTNCHTRPVFNGGRAARFSHGARSSAARSTTSPSVSASGTSCGPNNSTVCQKRTSRAACSEPPTMHPNPVGDHCRQPRSRYAIRIPLARHPDGRVGRGETIDAGPTVAASTPDPLPPPATQHSDVDEDVLLRFRFRHSRTRPNNRPSYHCHRDRNCLDDSHSFSSISAVHTDEQG